MTDSLRKRQEQYESCYDYFITRQLPICIKVKIKNFKKLTQNLEKPYSIEFSEIVSQAALFAISNIQDGVFCYCFNDEVIFILTNNRVYNQEPWHGNNLQKVASSISSLMTLGFIKNKDLFNKDISIVGDALFSAHVFTVPNLSEAVNYLIFKQSFCMGFAAHQSVLIELEKKLGKQKTAILLKDADYNDKIKLLLNHAGIDFLDFYLPSFIYGAAVYKIPVFIKTRDGRIKKNKWHVDFEIPNFITDRDFVSAILANGADVFRGADLDL